MKTILITVVLAACAALEGAAMPTKEETERAEPLVRKLMAPERAALESGKKTRTEVAAAAMKLADEADTEAAKLLLMKGAFVLYVKDGNLEKAVETMNTLEKAIADVPPQCVTNMIETALLGLSKKEDGVRLYRLLDAGKKSVGEASPPPHDGAIVQKIHKDRTTIQSIIDGMIKVPGCDCWLSETELTQGQWESVMGYNLSKHKGVNLPVENVSRNDCDVFLEKLNQTKEVRASQFVFRLPELREWKCAAWAGSGGRGSWIRPGVAGEVLDMAWVRENSSNQTHVVATKLPNAFGFYDMLGNVWEWLNGNGDGTKGRGHVKGCHFNQVAGRCNWNQNVYIPKNHRHEDCGLRLAAYSRSAGDRVCEPSDAKVSPSVAGKATVDGYSWSYRVSNGEATIVANTDVRYSCAVSPNPKGHVSIPATLGGARVTSIGRDAFWELGGLTSVSIPSSVTNIGYCAFHGCGGLTSVTIPPSVVSIERGAFYGCTGLKSVSLPEGLTSIGADAFACCSRLTSVTIPANVKIIEDGVFRKCAEIISVTMLGERPNAPDNAICDNGKLRVIHVPTNAKSWAGMKEWLGVPLVFDDAKAAPTAVALEEICNTNGLVHCWRFNGSLKDEIGGSEAKLEDGAKLENGYVSKRGKSNIDLGGQMLPAADNLTIELWVKANKVHDWDRLFVFGSDWNNRLVAIWSWRGKSSLEAVYEGKGMGQGQAPHFGTFEDGVEYHVALVIEKDGKHYRATTYRQNAQTCEILSSGSMLIENGWSPKAFVHKDSWLGRPYRGECNSDVCYNEVRIWDRALGEKELTQNAIKFHEAGETMKDPASGFDANLQVGKDRTTVQSIIDGMIKVPGRDFWLSETELTQGQWEAVMGYNYSKHQGANLPVDRVSRNECDMFLERLNRTKEVRSSQFEFALPKYAEEWVYAAHAGGDGDDCWIKPGVVGNLLDMEWMKENSSNQTHAVATKSPNAFGFYDMVGNVGEWRLETDGDRRGYVMGRWYDQGASQFSFGVITLVELNERGGGNLGVRLAAHLRTKCANQQEVPRAAEWQAQAEEEKAQREAERAEQRQQLQAIQEELRRVRAEKTAEANQDRVAEPARRGIGLGGLGDEEGGGYGRKDQVLPAVSWL